MKTNPTFAVLLAMIFSLEARAGLPPGLDGVRCKEAALSALAKAKVTGAWTRQVDPAPDAFSYRSATLDFGTWVEFHAARTGAPTLVVVSDKAVTMMEWDASSCVEKASTGPGFGADIRSQRGQIFFTDADLAKLLATKKSGIIYTWSPGMVYSAKYADDFKAVARKMGVEFQVLMDPYPTNANVTAAKNTFGKVPSERRLVSVELYMRNALVHAPSTFVYGNGRLHESGLFGVYTPETLKPELERRFIELGARWKP